MTFKFNSSSKDCLLGINLMVSNGWLNVRFVECQILVHGNLVDSACELRDLLMNVFKVKGLLH